MTFSWALPSCAGPGGYFDFPGGCHTPSRRGGRLSVPPIAPVTALRENLGGIGAPGRHDLCSEEDDWPGRFGAMTSGPSGALLMKQLRALCDGGAVGGLADGPLLDRFLA